MQTYCLVCRKTTDNANSKVVKTKGGSRVRSICTICGNKKSRFVSQGSGLFNSMGLNTTLNRQKTALWNTFKL